MRFGSLKVNNYAINSANHRLLPMPRNMKKSHWTMKKEKTLNIVNQLSPFFLIFQDFRNYLYTVIAEKYIYSSQVIVTRVLV